MMKKYFFSIEKNAIFFCIHAIMLRNTAEALQAGEAGVVSRKSGGRTYTGEM